MNQGKWDIGEFIKYELIEKQDSFTIIIEGNNKYKELIVDKVNEIEVTNEDLVKYELE